MTKLSEICADLALQAAEAARLAELGPYAIASAQMTGTEVRRLATVMERIMALRADLVDALLSDDDEDRGPGAFRFERRTVGRLELAAPVFDRNDHIGEAAQEALSADLRDAAALFEQLPRAVDGLIERARAAILSVNEPDRRDRLDRVLATVDLELAVLPGLAQLASDRGGVRFAA